MKSFIARHNRIFPIFFLFLSVFVFSSIVLANAESNLIKKARSDLGTWRTLLEMYYVDWIKYPEMKSI